MAIEIKIPEFAEKISDTILHHELLHLLPTILAYVVSFFFIGSIWYQHLKTFSVVKDYDRGLVIRNLILLFLIGLFPFSASLITRTKGTSVAFFIYLGVILCCIIAQFLLQHYILIRKPNLRVNTNLNEHLLELKKKKILVIGFSIAFVMCILTFELANDPQLRSLASLWVLPVVIVYRILTRKK